MQLAEALVAGGLASQCDLFVERSAMDPRCQWCRAAVGTARHRLFGCDGTQWVAQAYGCQDVAIAGRAAPPDDLGTLRCLVGIKLDWVAPPASKERCFRMEEALRVLWEGLVCVDGSATFPSHAALNRTGRWARSRCCPAAPSREGCAVASRGPSRG